MATGSWTLTEELFLRGDAAFVAELRGVHAPEQLGAFAGKWFADKRPFARGAIFEYLALPLNCYRHEPLVKRLFKLAEAAVDGELMGAFLVAFDRTIRRVRKTVTRSKHEQFENRASAEVAVRAWETLGFQNATINVYGGGRIYAYATMPAEVVVMPNNRMPRPTRQPKRAETLDQRTRARFEKRHILFSLPTRRYLRRRAWRYFRSMGKTDSVCYVRFAAQFLVRYRDDDVDSDIHLLDNWGLTHALFHNCPALRRPAKGWEFLPEKGLGDLAFAPRLETAWSFNPELVFDLLLEANCRTVRLFAVWLLQTKLRDWFKTRPVMTFLKLADHADPDVSGLGFDMLEASSELSEVPVEEWLLRLDGDDLEKLARLADLLTRRLDPSRVSLDDAVRLAAYRSRPVAALGFAMLKSKKVALADAPGLLALARADCDSLRPEIALWLRGTLTAFGSVEPAWILEFLDSHHADVRLAGWGWFRVSAVKKVPDVWHKLMESPYADVRGWLAGLLADVLEDTETDTLLFLWATVLCSIHRGGRQKPGVVAQIVGRIAKNAADAPKLLPLLAVAVRSLRGPEFRAGLAGLVMLSETKPELVPSIRRQFPELTF